MLLIAWLLNTSSKMNNNLYQQNTEATPLQIEMWTFNENKTFLGTFHLTWKEILIISCLGGALRQQSRDKATREVNVSRGILQSYFIKSDLYLSVNNTYHLT